MKLPVTPPNNAIIKHGTAGMVAPFTDVRNPEHQNVRPMSKLPAMPQSVPSALIPPLVPLGTVCKRTWAPSQSWPATNKTSAEL